MLYSQLILSIIKMKGERSFFNYLFMKKIFVSALMMFVLIMNTIHAQTKPARIIIRGDDMGFSHAGNLGIIESYKNGIETSVEVLVPSPWYPEAVELLK